MKTKILFVVGIWLFLSCNSADCNATTSNFLSAHSLGKQDEVTDALAVLCKQIRPDVTIYEFGKVNYTLYGWKINCTYIDGRQDAEVTSNDTVRITGGMIEFSVNFTYSVSRIGPDKAGTAYGIV
jgi:hypothetical protein